MRWVMVALMLASVPAWGQEQPQVLPRGVLFDPLMADPRWPHFSAALHDYGGDGGAPGVVGAVSLGNGFSFYQAPGLGGSWSIGLQAAVFAVFDLESESKDLVNADYWVGIPLAWRSGSYSAMLRLYHQSSHLGDEFILRSPQNARSRVNLSYEVVDFKLSRDFYDRMLRVYAGAGYLFDQEPSDLKHGLIQLGAEFRAPWTFADGLIRPIAAIDIQATEDSQWDGDLSARAGFELSSTQDRDYTLRLLLEYYKGRNPNGQFYDRDLEFWGLGLHAYF